MNGNWQEFLESTCRKRQLTRQEEKILICLPQNSMITKAELLDFYNKKSKQENVKELSYDALTGSLKNIYKKFEILHNLGDKLRHLQNNLLDEYGAWNNRHSFFLRVGLNNVYPRFPRETFKNELEKVILLANEKSKQVDILQTFAPNLSDYSDQLIECIKNGVPVRILLAWPYSEAARLREEALRRYSRNTYVDINIRNEVMENLEILERVLTVVGQTMFLQIKLYDTLPSLAIYRLGNYLLMGVFTHGELAVNTFQFELGLIAPEPIIIDTLTCEFEVMWNLAREFYPTPGTNWRNKLEILF